MLSVKSVVAERHPLPSVMVEGSFQLQVASSIASRGLQFYIPESSTPKVVAKRTTIGVEEQSQQYVATEQLTVYDDKPRQLKTGLRPTCREEGLWALAGKNHETTATDVRGASHRTGWLRLHR